VLLRISSTVSNSQRVRHLHPVQVSLATGSATDGGGTTKTNLYRTVTNGIPANQSLTFDLNGNMTSDGTNTYQWDAENRLIQVNYPGSGNNSKFNYDSYGLLVGVIETAAGIVSSTKQFVMSFETMCEARNASGTLIAQYFPRGENLSGTKYFYSDSHEGSVLELTDNSGTVQASYRYGPYGQATKLQGTVTSDFQYGGYYNHGPSGLSFAAHRAYSASLGRWINRDPAGEYAGSNLYAYVGNDPIIQTDPLGFGPLGFAIGIAYGAPIGGIVGIGAGGTGGTLVLPGVGTVAGAVGLGSVGFVGGGLAGGLIGSGIEDNRNMMSGSLHDECSRSERFGRIVRAWVNSLRPKKTCYEIYAAALAAAAADEPINEYIYGSVKATLMYSAAVALARSEYRKCAGPNAMF
jgi:RHS repeat-associated protein